MPAVERGKVLEPMARIWAEDHLGFSLIPLCIEHSDNPRHAASLDGYDLEHNIVCEIKCPGQKNHQAMVDGEIPIHYKLQILWQIYVSGASHGYLVSFGGLDGVAHRIDPDPILFDRMMKAVISFERMLDDLEEPPLTDADTYVETSEEWLEIAELKKKTAAALKQAEYEDKVVNTKLEELANGRVRIKGGGISYSQSLRKGSIDYSLAVKELGIPQSTLDTYRRSPSVSTTIRVNHV